MNLMERINFMRMKDKMQNQINDELLDNNGLDLKSLLIGLAIGSAAATLITMLFAPKSGKNTRAYLSNKSQELGQKVKGTMNDTMDKANQLVTKGQTQAETKKQQAKQRAKDLSYQAREDLSDTLERTADKVEPSSHA